MSANHLKPFKLLVRVPEGTCPECAMEHEPELPHNVQSAVYQYSFYDRHGRWPTWADAMAHCSREVKDFWLTGLKDMEVEVTAAEIETAEATAKGEEAEPSCQRQ